MDRSVNGTRANATIDGHLLPPVALAKSCSGGVYLRIWGTPATRIEVTEATITKPGS